MTIKHMPAGADLFSSTAEAIVNPVNCVGVMGKGLALAFKNAFPANYVAYRNVCDQRKLKPGGLCVYIHPESDHAVIINLATKDHWNAPSKIEWVRAGAIALRTYAEENRFARIACPALGGGNGGLLWEGPDSVLAVLTETLKDSTCEFELYPPHEAAPNPRYRTKP